MTHTVDYRLLTQSIGYEFNKLELLKEALRHRSAKGKHNERLEFLGDSVLGLAIAEALYQKFNKATEGELSKLRASLVKGDTLVDLAQGFALGDFIHLGPSELKSGGFRRASILENAMEALIGAIYLDAGFETAKHTVQRWYAEKLKQASLDESFQEVQDPKTQLQERLQAKGLPLPEYKVVKTEGAEHEQIFYVSCTVASLDKISEGSGSSRKRAEAQAAANMLQQLGKHS